MDNGEESTGFDYFESINFDEVEVVEVDPYVPSRINSMFAKEQLELDKKKEENNVRPSVLVTHENVPRAAIEKLREKYNVIIIEKADDQEAILRKASGVHAIFLCGPSIRLNKDMIDFIGEKLTVVGLMSASYDHVDVRELSKKKIKIGNTRSVLIDSVAELALCLALSVAHRFKEGYTCSAKGKWVTGDPDWLLGKQLNGSVCGIIGFGDIGTAIAARLTPFGVMRIMYSGHGQKKAAKDPSIDFVELSELLPISDFIFVACPLTVETQYMFNYDTFLSMKPTSVLINVSKAGVVKTNDLVKALTENRIWGAGLDVADPEPLPHDHPLIHLDNCFLSPNLGSATHATREAMAILTADNIIAALEGTSMPSEVCFKSDSQTDTLSSASKPKRTLAKHTLKTICLPYDRNRRQQDY